MISVVGIGDNTVDRYIDQGLMYPGGNAVNVAVHARRLGNHSAYIGCIAKDNAGNLIYESLIKEKVDVSHCRLLEGENAFCDIRLEDGNREFGEFSAGVCDQLIPEKDDLEFISTFDLTHTSVYSFLDSHLKSLQSNTQFLSYDFSNEWDRELLKEKLPLIDFALISNPVEDIYENNDLIRWSVAQGPQLVMVTSGEQGAVVGDGNKVYYQPIIPVNKIVDTLGAGDAFVSSFLTEFLLGVSIPDALEKAALYAAGTCAHFGAFGHGVKFKK